MTTFGGSSFPSGLDAYGNVTDGVDTVDADHTNSLATAIENIEAKVGVDDSVVTTTFDYVLKQGRHTSKQADGGVAYQFNTQNTFTSGDLVAYRNGGSDRLTVDYQGDVTVGVGGSGIVRLGSTDVSKRIIADQGASPDGEIRYNPTTNKWELSNDGGAFSAIQTAAAVGSMQDVYDGGSDIALSAAEGSVKLTRGGGPNATDSAFEIEDTNLATARTAPLLAINDQNVLGATPEAVVYVTRSDVTNSPVWVRLESTADAAGGAVLDFKQDRTTPADDDAVGIIRATGKDGVSAPQTWAEIELRADRVLDANERGSVVFRANRTETVAEIFELLAGTTSGGAIVRSSIAADAADVFRFRAANTHTGSVDVLKVEQADGATELFAVSGGGNSVTSGVIQSGRASTSNVAVFRLQADPDTGVGFPAANQVSAVAGGSDVMITSTAGTQWPHTGADAVSAATQTPSYVSSFVANTYTGAAAADRVHSFYAGVLTSADEAGGYPVAGFYWDIDGDTVLVLHGNAPGTIGGPQGAVFRSMVAASTDTPFRFVCEDNVSDSENMFVLSEAAGSTGFGSTRFAVTGRGTVLVGIGDATTPAVSFISDQNTGIFRGAVVSQMGFSANGVEILRLDATTATEFATLLKSGTAAAAASQAPSHILRYTASTWSGAAEVERDYDWYAHAITSADEAGGNPVSGMRLDADGFPVLIIQGDQVGTVSRAQRPVFRSRAAVTDEQFAFVAEANLGGSDQLFTLYENAGETGIGTIQFSVLGSGQVQTRGDQISAPDYTFIGDNDTGIGRQGANLLGFWSAGAVVVDVDNNTPPPLVRMLNTNATQTTGPELRLALSDGAAGANNDVCGSITFYADNDGPTATEFGKITGVATSVVGGGERGQLVFYATYNSGLDREVLRMSAANGAASAGLVLANAVADGSTPAMEFRAVSNFGASNTVFSWTESDGATTLAWITGEGRVVAPYLAQSSASAANAARIFRQGDTDTGLGWPNTNQVSLVAGGDDCLIVDNSSAPPTITVLNTNATQTAGPELRLALDDGAAGQDNDLAGQITFYADDDAQAQTEFGGMGVTVLDATAATKSGYLSFWARNTSLATILELRAATDASGAPTDVIFQNTSTDATAASFAFVSTDDRLASEKVFEVFDNTTTSLLSIMGDGDLVVAQDIEAVGGYKYAIWFFDGTLTANQTDQPLYPTGGGATGQQDYVASYGGSIVAITGILSTAVTAGALTVDVRVGGTKVYQLQFTSSDGATKTVAQAKDTDAFVANDIIDALWSTDASFAGPNSMTVKVMIEE